MKKKILFITGTRADYGKIKPLINSIYKSKNFQVQILITGMHLLSKYGNTYTEIEDDFDVEIFKLKNIQKKDGMNEILSRSINQIGAILKKIKPNLIFVHGDRIEALAGTICGVFNNYLVAHVEGGDVSGTIDESIRHAITKFAQIHFVTGLKQKRRLIQLGENTDNIYVLGLTEKNILLDKALPSLKEVKTRYEINYSDYAIMIFHPVTTEQDEITKQTKIIINSIKSSKLNYIIIYPNNDLGSDKIFKIYEGCKNYKKFRFLPSMRFEYFLTLLKNSNFIIGNSSVGVLQSPIYNLPSINLGTRQNNRNDNKNIIHSKIEEKLITKYINSIKKIKNKSNNKSLSNTKYINYFKNILRSKKIWQTNVQKHFLDL